MFGDSNRGGGARGVFPEYCIAVFCHLKVFSLALMYTYFLSYVSF